MFSLISTGSVRYQKLFKIYGLCSTDLIRLLTVPVNLDRKNPPVCVYKAIIFAPQESLLLPYSLWRDSLLTPMTPPLKTVGAILILRLLSKITFAEAQVKQVTNSFLQHLTNWSL